MLESSTATLEPIQQQVNEAAAMPLGQHITPENLVNILPYLEDKMGKNTARADLMGRLYETAAAPRDSDEWDPALARVIVEGLGATYVISNITTDSELDHASTTEESFQALCAGQFTSNYGFMSEIGLAHALLPADKVTERLSQINQENPHAVLDNLAKIQKFLGADEALRQAGAAIENLPPEYPLRLDELIEPEVVQCIGLEEAVRKTKLLIEEKKAAGNLGHVDYLFSQLIDHGLISPAEVVELATDNIAVDVDQGLNALNRLAGREGLDPEIAKGIKDTIDSFIMNPETDNESVAKALHLYNIYGYIPDNNLLRKAYEVHGTDLAMCLPNSYKDVLGEEEFGKLLTAHIDQLYGQMQTSEENLEAANEASEALLKILVNDELYSSTSRTTEERSAMLLQVALQTPDKVIEKIGFGTFAKLDIVANSNILVTALSRASARQLSYSYEYIKREALMPDEVLFDTLLERCIAESQVGLCAKSNLLLEHMDASEKRRLFEAAINEIVAGDDADYQKRYDLAYVISSAIRNDSEEEGRRLLAYMPEAEQLSVSLQLARERPRFFNAEEAHSIIGRLESVADRQQLNLFCDAVDAFAYTMTKTELAQTIDRIATDNLGVVVDHANRLFKYLPLELRSKYLSRAEAVNPAGLLAAHNRQGIEGVDPPAIIERMNSDERLGFAPRYFKKLLTQLPKSAQTTAYITMLKEATGIFSKINQINSSDQAKAAHQRITGSGLSSGSKEVGVLQGLSLLAQSGQVLDTLHDADDVQQAVSGRLLNRLGINDIDDPGLLRETLPNVIPLAIYSEDFYKHELSPTLKQLVDATARGEYKSWKYDEPNFAELQEQGILPSELTPDQYKVWQQSDKLDVGEVGGVDTEALARKVSATLIQAAPYIPQLQSILQNGGEPSVISEEAVLGIREIGRQTGELHLRRKNIQPGTEEAEEIESQLAVLAHERQVLDLTVTLTRLMELSGAEVAAGRLMNNNGKLTNKTIPAAFKEIIDVAGSNAEDVLVPIETELGAVNESRDEVQGLSVHDTDDLATTMEIGAYPVGSCQHYEQGAFRQGLLSYTDPNVKVMIATNNKGGLVARSIMRLIGDDAGNPVVVLEQTYTSYPSVEIERAMLVNAQRKAEKLGAKLFVSALVSEDYRDSEITSFKQSGSRSPIIYSDSGGGVRTVAISPVEYKTYAYKK